MPPTPLRGPFLPGQIAQSCSVLLEMRLPFLHEAKRTQVIATTVQTTQTSGLGMFELLGTTYLAKYQNLFQTCRIRRAHQPAQAQDARNTSSASLMNEHRDRKAALLMHRSPRTVAKTASSRRPRQGYGAGHCPLI